MLCRSLPGELMPLRLLCPGTPWSSRRFSLAVKCLEGRALPFSGCVHAVHTGYFAPPLLG